MKSTDFGVQIFQLTRILKWAVDPDINAVSLIFYIHPKFAFNYIN